MDEQALCYTDIATLGRLYRTRVISPTEATRAVLDRIRRLDQRLNSFITVLEQPNRHAGLRPSWTVGTIGGHCTACPSRSRI
jgi:Asp-tRNA(Asn)/Glu-tRNA(Gln) amidotransferase A subunit family amidase